MRLVERSQQNPAAVAAAAAIVLLFGALALLRLPIQLLPDTRQPELFISASWREAAPAELEEALIEPIEEAMRGLPGLVVMRSGSNRGRGGVGLTFEVGTDMTRVMLDVVSRLNSLPPLPPDADEPQVFGGDNWQTENAASLLVRPPARGARHLRSAPPRRARHHAAASRPGSDRRARRVGGLCQRRAAAIHRARHRARAGRRPRRPGLRLERGPPAVPARRGRRARRARRCRVVRVPQRRAIGFVEESLAVGILLASGNTVEVELPLGEPQRRLAVPRDALIIRAEGLYVYRVDEGQRAERIGVEAGVADGEWIAVSGGLQSGDQIVVRGGELLRGGEKLQVIGIFEAPEPRSVVAGR